MATYLKRSSNKPFTSRSSASVATATSSRSTLTCPVCQSLLKKPVSLPCGHNLCLDCLRNSIEHSSLSCPLCRQRLGSWLRAVTCTSSSDLINHELWQHIRLLYPAESSTHADNVNLNEFNEKKILSAAGEIRQEYEVQLQEAKEEMRHQREKERLASEALIRQIQEAEEQDKLLQLAQDQLLAKTLAKQDLVDKTKKHERTPKITANFDKSKINVGQSKSSFNQKMSVKTTDSKKHVSKVRFEKCKESSDSHSQKLVPIHNAVTRVVTHQSRVNQPNNSNYSTLRDIDFSNSKIYGLQCKEELQVPNDIVSSKKKKLGVEVCVTTVGDEERIGSAESAGSHDSINQEIHHFKPIKALPRTPLRTTIDGKQIDPKLIRVLAIQRRVSNAVPKPPTPTHLKKNFGCSWSAFKRVIKQQVLQKDFSNTPSHNNQSETKKTENKPRGGPRSSKVLQQVIDSSSSCDSNKNYTNKSLNRVYNGAKVNKKITLADLPNANGKKQPARLKNGLRIYSKQDETVQIKDDDSESLVDNNPQTEVQPISIQAENDKPYNPFSDVVIENIAERIKRRKRPVAATDTCQSAVNQVPVKTLKRPKSKTKKLKAKLPEPLKKRNTSKTKRKLQSKQPIISRPKSPIVTTVTSQIKRLAARSVKRPKYTEDSSESDSAEDEQPLQPVVLPVKRSRKSSKPVKRVIVPHDVNIETVIKEQERLERLAEQERADRELALKLQASFDAIERIGTRTRRGQSQVVSSVDSLLSNLTPQLERRTQNKRAPIK